MSAEENSEDKKREKLSLMTELIKLANSDNEIKDIEFNFLLSLAVQLGISKDDFKHLFEDYIEFYPPKLEHERIIQFHRLILMMNVDQQIDESEIQYIRELGIRMGLHPHATEEVLKIMKDYPNMIVPPEKLIQIFRTFHN